MNTEELSNRLTQILTGITSGEPNPNIIQGFVQNFIEDFKPDLTQGLHIFLYDIYTGIISHCQTNKPTNQEPIYESEHIIILDSDSTIGCQE